MLRLSDWATPSLILLSLLVSHVKYHRYPLWSPEVLLCVGALVLVGTGLCLLALLRRETLYPLIIGLLALLFLDVQFHVFALTLGAVAWLSPVFATLLLLGGFFAFMFLIFVLRREIGRIASAAWGVVLLTTLLLPSDRVPAGEVIAKDAQSREDLPLVLHLVLDEQIGVAGIPELPGGADLRMHLVSQLLENGFTVYGRAFSQYSESQLALASLVNGEVFSASPDYVVPTASGYKITRNDWLRSLSQAGYSVRIYESGWIDFCQAAGVSTDYCFVYPTNSIGVLRDFDLGAWSKARLILPRLFEGSLDFFSWKPQLSTLACPAVMSKLAEDIGNHPRGAAFFVHLLWPHYAYAFDAQCGLRSDVGTWANVGDIGATESEEFNSQSEREYKYSLYFQQVRCVIKRLDALFQQMRRVESLSDATVVIHGDHGSRLASKAFHRVDPADLSERDMIDHYSTLMAIRLPGSGEQYAGGQESIQKVFARRLLNRPLRGPAEEVYVRQSRKPSGDEALLSRPMVEMPPVELPPLPSRK